MIDLEPCLRAVQTFHPRARGAVLILHDEDGDYQVNCASFLPSGDVEAHHAEFQKLVSCAPIAAKKWRDMLAGGQG